MYGEEYTEQDVEVVLIGENHGVAAHGDKEHEIIEAVEPEYVALEIDRWYDIDEKIKQMYHYQTLSRTNKVCEAVTGRRYVDDTEQLQEELQQRTERWNGDTTGRIPQTEDELLHTRISEFDAPVRVGLKQYAEQRQEEEEHELYADIRKTIKHWKTNEMNGYRAQARFVDNIYDDVHQGRFLPISWDNRDFDPDLSFPPTQQERAALEESYRRRERFGANKVAGYVERTEQPIMVLMGEHHLGNDAVFEETLADLDVTYDSHILDGDIEDDISHIVSGTAD